MTEHNHERGRTYCNVCVAERMRRYRVRKKAGVAEKVTRLDWRADDVDPVAIQRALAGTDVGRPLHPREKRVLVRILLARNASVNDVTRLLHVSSATARELMGEAS